MAGRLRRAWSRADASATHLGNALIDDGVDALAPRLSMATLHDELLVCEHCDELYQRASFDNATLAEPGEAVAPSGRHYECRRCGAPMGLARHASFDLPLALALTGLVLLAVAHLNVILSMDLQGQTRQTTLWEAAWALYDDGDWILCGLVLFTTLINPFLELGAIVFVLLPLRNGHRPPGHDIVLRAMQAVRPWVMVEVFMLGVLVALVKLSSLARVTPGVGLWAFGATMLVIAAAASAFDHENVWAATDAAKRAEAQPEPDALDA